MSEIRQEDLSERVLQIMRGYCGDPFARRTASIKAFSIWAPQQWPFPEFQRKIASITESIPPQYRDVAVVYLNEDEPGAEASFEIAYARPETDEEISNRVRKAYDYAQTRLAEERRTYERLKRQFEHDHA